MQFLCTFHIHTCKVTNVNCYIPDVTLYICRINIYKYQSNELWMNRKRQQMKN